jgi:DNA-binding protein YbaB
MSEIRGLDGLADYALSQVERLERVQRALLEIVGEGASPRGFVRACTGPQGSVQRLTIEDDALRLGGAALAEEVVAAIQAAQQQYAAQADELMTAEVGMRPSASNEAFDAGVARLEALTEQLDELSRRLPD